MRKWQGLLQQGVPLWALVLPAVMTMEAQLSTQRLQEMITGLIERSELLTLREEL